MKRKIKHQVKQQGSEQIYKESWKYLKHIRKSIYLIALLFLCGALIGYAFSDFFAYYFDDIIKGIIEETKGLGFVEMIFFIFGNNLMSSIAGFLLGVFFGVFPIFVSLFNGTLIGYVYNRASAIDGPWVIWRLFPHGIFELPAVFISLGLGLRLGGFIFSKNKKKAFISRLKEGMKVFLAFVIPLLIIAAVIEGILIFFVG